MDVLEKRRINQKRNTKNRKEKFTVGDIVLYRNILRKGKLEPRLIGPYIIVKVSKVGSCKIKEFENG